MKRLPIRHLSFAIIGLSLLQTSCGSGSKGSDPVGPNQVDPEGKNRPTQKPTPNGAGGTQGSNSSDGSKDKTTGDEKRRVLPLPDPEGNSYFIGSFPRPVLEDAATSVDSSAVWPESLKALEASQVERFNKYLESESFKSRQYSPSLYVSLREIKADLDKLDTTPVLQANLAKIRADLLALMSKSKEKGVQSTKAFETQSGKAFGAFQKACQTSLTQVSSTTRRLKRSFFTMAGVPSDVATESQGKLEELAAGVDALGAQLCLSGLDFNTLFPTYAPQKEAYFSLFDPQQQNSPAAALLVSVDAATQALMERNAKLIESFHAALVAIPPAEKKLSEGEITSVVRETFAATLRDSLNRWYWQNLCGTGERTAPDSQHLCGMKKSTLSPDARIQRILEFSERLPAQFSTAWFDSFTAASVSKANHYFVDAARSELDSAANLYVMDRSVSMPTYPINRLKDVLWYIRQDSYSDQLESRKDTNLYDVNWYLRQDSYSDQLESRKDTTLYDAYWYIRQDSYSDQLESRKDTTLYDAYWYIRQDSYSDPLESRKDTTLYDANWYIRQDTYSDFQSSRKAINYYDCVGITKSVPACEAILENFRSTLPRTSARMKATTDAVKSRLASNTALKNAQNAATGILGRATEDAKKFTSFPENPGADAIGLATDMAKAANAPFRQDNGQINHKNLWIYGMEATLSDRLKTAW